MSSFEYKTKEMQTDSPLVSVIMPSYNHARYISESIESILNQSLNDFEFIIIDDNSRDNSKSIIESYTRTDSRIIPIYHDVNQGIAKTVNDGLAEANGRYIALTASDDKWKSDKLSRQVSALEAGSESISWTQGQLINHNGGRMGETFLQRNNAEERPRTGELFHELIKGNYIFGSSLLYDSTVAENIKFDTDLKYLNDYKFVLELSTRGSFNFIDDCLTYYRIHGENTTLSEDWDRVVIKERLAIRSYARERHSSRLKNKGLQKTYLQDVVDWFRLNKLHRGLSAFYNSVQINPYSVNNVLYIGYALASFVPGAQPILSQIWKRLRLLFD